MQSTERFDAALKRIDDVNGDDPNHQIVDGQPFPKELIYGRRMSSWLARLYPDASEALRIAARAQHIKRWSIPRNTYPMDRKGYLRWRTELKNFHATTTGDILDDLGYDAATIDAVQSLLRKEALRENPETQALEDVACLVFLENHFADFAAQHDDEKVIDIVRKTWGKMSEHAHQAALGLDLPDTAKALVVRALS